MSTSSIRFGSDVDGMRSEDIPLLTGRGQFSDDLNVEGQLHAVFVRSPVAHADMTISKQKKHSPFQASLAYLPAPTWLPPI